MSVSVVVWMWAAEKPPKDNDPRPPVAVWSVDEQKLLEKRIRLAARYPSDSRYQSAARQSVDAKRLTTPNAPNPKHYRHFDASHVNVMQKMMARQLPGCRFICISDENAGFSSDVEWLKTPPEAAALANIMSPEGARFPSCYRRLWVFSEAARVLGERILCLDIDLVATGSLLPIVDTNVDFMGWRPFRDWGKKLRFGGGQYLLRTGTRTHVWDRFKGADSIMEARAAGFRGSDQAWLSYCLADKEPYWPNTSGLYSVRDLGPGLALPKDARLVQFNGHQKPWDHAKIGTPGWVLEHWR